MISVAKMESAINETLKHGTKIVSFLYNGKLRNALIGSKAASCGKPSWGTQFNRAIRLSKTGEKYLSARMMNEGDGVVVKTFSLRKIRNLSILKA